LLGEMDMENKMYMNENQTPLIERICPKCGDVLKKEWQACPNCGWTMALENKVSHGAAAASIVLSLIGFAFFGFILGFIGIALGAQAVSKNKDKLGYIGLILGIIVVVMTFIGFIALLSQPYY
jgi:hypothetical protein